MILLSIQYRGPYLLALLLSPNNSAFLLYNVAISPHSADYITTSKVTANSLQNPSY